MAMQLMPRLLRDSPDLELGLLATDEHVNVCFENTLRHITKELPVPATVDIEQVDNRTESRSRALGHWP